MIKEMNVFKKDAWLGIFYNLHPTVQTWNKNPVKARG